MCFSIYDVLIKSQITFDFLVDFKDDPDIYAYDHLKYVGIELWQVSLTKLYKFWCYSFIVTY